MTLDAAEFTRRFLLHVLPSGFHRIRHPYALSHCVQTFLQKCGRTDLRLSLRFVAGALEIEESETPSVGRRVKVA